MSTREDDPNRKADTSSEDEWDSEDDGFAAGQDEDDEGFDGDADAEPEGTTETPAALDELEEKELMLTEDEAAQVIAVDEAEVLRTIARETRALESGVDTAGEDEFVCQSCFLVKRVSQRAGPRKKICRDCAA